MFKKILITFCLISSLALAAGRNINGTTGYLVMPNAEGLRFQEYHLALSAFSGTDTHKQHWKFYGGLGTAEGSEISFMGRSEREGFFLNTKWFGTLGHYADPLLVGIGLENVSSLGTHGDHPNMYMVVTKKFLGGSSFSIGSTGRYIEKEIQASMMAGFEIFSAPNLSFLADTVAYAENKYNLNVGLRVYSTRTTYFNLSVLNAAVNQEVRDFYPTVVTIGLTMHSFM